MAKLEDITTLTWSKISLGIATTMVGEAVLDGALLHLPAFAQFGFTAVGVGAQTGISVLRGRRRAADLRAIEEREAKAERERLWREQVHTIAVPDPAPNQCPVCGLDDLADLIQRDSALELTGTKRARVTAYGPVFAHQECAEATPYAEYYKGMAVEKHRRGLHHAVPYTGCSACQREKDTGTKDPIAPPDGCTCSGCNIPPKERKWWEHGDVSRLTSLSVYPNQRYLWTCKHNDSSGYGVTHEAAAQALIVHARTACKGADHIHGAGGVYLAGCQDCNAAQRNALMRDRSTAKYAYPIEQGRSQFESAMRALADVGIGVTPKKKPDKHGDYWHGEHCPECMRQANESELEHAWRIKNAVAPKTDPMDWLVSALQSSDPGVRAAAETIMRRLNGG